MSAELAAAVAVIADFQDSRYARTATTPEDDGTEAESLAEVSVPAFPDVLVHGRPLVSQ